MKTKSGKRGLSAGLLVFIAILIFSITFFSSTFFSGNTYASASIANVGGSLTFSYTGAAQTFTPTYAGYYQIELWGASGGDTQVAGGNGAYTKGVVLLGAGETLYVQVGQSGNGVIDATYNGGGSSNPNGYNAKAGGGATDVRLIGGTWNDFESLKSRIMVAAGGGGADGYSGGSVGGAGGLFTGGNGNYYGVTAYTVATGGGQTYGGGGGSGAATGYSGTFGRGGNNNSNHGAGGGGGYYGGGGACYNGSVVGSGAGGSSYISGGDGYNAIDVNATASTLMHTGDSYHYSGKVFTDISATAGANDGNGQAKITFVRQINNIVQVSSASGLVIAAQGASNLPQKYFSVSTYTTSGRTITYQAKNLSSGVISTITNISSLAVGEYELTCTVSVGGKSSSAKTNLSVRAGGTLNPSSTPVSSQTFGYTGGQQTFTVTQSGFYQIELWGASGGKNVNTKGAYVKGTIFLEKGVTLYVYVGQYGENVAANTYAFNGGGPSPAASKAGGGATDIRLTGGAWDNYDGLKSRIMVASGGGGYEGYQHNSNGAHGGGLTGNNGLYTSPVTEGYAGKGGTQTSGGAGKDGANGSFGKGGAGQNGSPGDASHIGGGGGGGYYGGGGSGWHASAGGGSSYISGHAGSNSVSAGSTGGSHYHTGSANHYSGRVFINTSMTDGSASQKPRGNGGATISLLHAFNKYSEGSPSLDTGSFRIQWEKDGSDDVLKAQVKINNSANAKFVSFPVALVSAQTYSAFNSYVYGGYAVGDGYYEFAFKNTYKNAAGVFAPYIIKAAVYSSPTSGTTPVTLAESVYVDNTAPATPSISLSRTQDYYFAAVNATMSGGADGQSGQAGLEYKIGSGSWTSVSVGGAIEISSASTGVETKTVYLRSRDNAGNYSAETSKAVNFDRTQYTISYNLGAYMTNNTNNPSTYNVETSTFTIDNPSKTGFIFDGWFSNSQLTAPASTSISKFSRGNIVIYPKFTIDTSALTVSNSGGTDFSQTYNTGANTSFTGAASHPAEGTTQYFYQWEISTNGGSSYSAVTGAEGVTYTVSALASNGTYYYRLKARAENSGQTTGWIAAGAVKLTVNPKLLAAAWVSSLPDVIYKGAKYTPSPAVTDPLGNRALIAGTDITLSYGENTAAGTGTVTVTGINNYQGSSTVSFSILQKTLRLGENPTVTAETVSELYYAGVALTPEPTVRDIERNELLGASDYDVAYIGNLNAGPATVFISGKGNYIGGISIYFTILPKPFVIGGTPAVTANPIADYVFDGTAKTPVPVINDIARGRALDPVDYTYEYADNLNAGVAKITVSARNNYSGEFVINFNINPKTIVPGVNASIEAIGQYTYNGSPALPTPAVTDTDRVYKITEITYSYIDNLNAYGGTPKVIITAHGNYAGTIEINFTILPKTLGELTAEVESPGTFAYAGVPIMPEPPVRDIALGTVLGSGDFDYSYRNNLNSYDSPEVIITGKNNYSGTIVVPFIIERISLTPAFSGGENLIYDGTVKVITASAAGVNGEVPQFAVSFDRSPRDAGSYTATAVLTTAPVNLNYRIAGGDTYNFTVEKRGARIVFRNYEGLVYDGTERSIQVSFSHYEEDIIYTDGPELTLTYNATPKDSGSYTATARISDSNYYIAGAAAQAFTIAKKEITVSAAYFTKRFGETDPEFAAYRSSGTPDGDIKIIYERDVTAANPLDYQETGFYPFISVRSESANYTVSFIGEETGGLTINRAELLISPRQFSKTYGDEDPVLAEDVATGIFGIVVRVSYTREEGETAGPYSLVSLTADNENRFDTSFASGAQSNRMLIRTRSLRLEIPSQSKVYGSADPRLNYMIYVEDLAESDVGKNLDELLRITVTRQAGENYREQGYPLTATMTNTNYSLTVLGDAVFFINRFVVQITAEEIVKSKVYDGSVGAQITVSTNLTEGLRTDSGFNATARFSQKDAGDNIDILVEYTVSEAAKDNFYIPSAKIVAGGRIDKRALIAAISDMSMVYGDTPPVPQITYTNFAQGENLNNIGITQPEIEYNGLSALSPVGSYVINIRGGSAGNYQIDISDSAVITVTPAPLTIAPGAVFVKTADGTITATVREEHYSLYGVKNNDKVKINFRAYLLSSIPGNTYVEMVNISSLDPNYTVSPATIRLPARIRSLPYILAPVISLTFNGGPRYASVSVTLDGSEYYNYTVTYRAADYPETTDAPINTGEYTVKVTVTGDDFEPVTAESTLTITKIAPNLRIIGETKQVYGDFKPFTARVTAVLLDEELPVTYSFEGRPNTGAHTVYANYPGSRNYFPVTASGSFTVAKRDITAVFVIPKDIVYNGQARSISASFIGLAEGDNPQPIISYSGGVVPVDAGFYTANVTINDSNYNLIGNTSTGFSIAKKTLVVSIEPGEIKQGASPDSLIVYNGFAAGDNSSTLEFSPKAKLIVNSDGSKFAVLENGKSTNYNIVLEEGKTTAEVKIVYPEPAKDTDINFIYYIIGGLAGAAVVVTVLAIINKKRILRSYIREHS